MAKRKRSHRQPRKQNEGIVAHDQEAEATCITKFHCMVPVDRDLAVDILKLQYYYRVTTTSANAIATETSC